MLLDTSVNGTGLQQVREADRLGSRILIVDDTASARLIISTLLQEAGYTDLHMAVNGVEALEAIEQYDPDLVILDIMMPVMDGFEVCINVRQNEDKLYLPILVQTAAEARERMRAFEVGASDVLSKPIDAAEMLARVKVQLDLKLMRESNEAAHRRMSEELAAAQTLQTTLMPDEAAQAALNDGSPFQIAAHYESSSELSGDLWGVLRVCEKKSIALYTLDFTGHGVVAALNTFRTHAMIQDMQEYWLDPVAMMQELNARLKKILPIGQFCTMTWMVFEVDNAEVKYASAGAPPILHWDSQANKVHMLETDGLPVGVMTTVDYPLRTFQFHTHDHILQFSDALIESPNTQGDFLPEERVAELFAALAELNGTEIIQGILEVFSIGRTRPLHDDLTVVTMSC